MGGQSVCGVETGQHSGADVDDHPAVRMVRGILAKAVELMRAQGETRTGGFFALSGPGTPSSVYIELWGALPDDKRYRSSEIVLEKIRRLEVYPCHFTSYQSRNPHATIIDLFGREQLWGKLGGAIRAGDYSVSFDGFPELWNEAAMLVLAIRMRWLDETATLRRISRKRNPHFRILLEAMGEVE